MLAFLACGRLAAQPPITALAFAPEGDAILAGSQSGVTVYSWPDLRLRQQLECRSENVHDIAFAMDAKRFAVGGGLPAQQGYVEFYAWPACTPLGSTAEHQDSVLSVTWLDDLLLASSSLDHEILMWDSQQLTPQQRLSGHSRGVASVGRLNAELLVSGGFDNNLRVWDLPSGKLIRSLNNHTQSIRKLTVRPGEQRLPMVASISDDHTVRFWQPSIGRLVRFARLDETPTDCCWIRDGQSLAVACKDGQVRLVDPESAVVTNSIPVFQDWALSIALQPNGAGLAVGGREGQLKMIDLNELSAETD